MFYAGGSQSGDSHAAVVRIRQAEVFAERSGDVVGRFYFDIRSQNSSRCSFPVHHNELDAVSHDLRIPRSLLTPT